MTLYRRRDLGFPMTELQFDGNIDDFDDRLIALENAAVHPSSPFDSVTPFTVAGDQFYIKLADATTYGPFDLPQVAINPRGEWFANTTYLRHDWLTHGGKLYEVLNAHVSDTVFDPGANDGSGGDFYRELLSLQVAISTSDQTTDITVSTSLVNTYVRMINGGTITFPTDLDIALGAEFYVRQVGATGVHFLPQAADSSGDGTTINFPTGRASFTDRLGATVGFKYVGANEWDAFGDLAEDVSA